MQFFKVTSSDRKSLGLRRNPTILSFPLGKWVESSLVKKGNSDDGGIWLAATLSNAKRLKKYMFKHYGKQRRILEQLLVKFFLRIAIVLK